MTVSVEQALKQIEEANEWGVVEPKEPAEPKYEEPAPIVVSETDRLKAENINLRLMTSTQRESLLQNELNELERRINEAQAQLLSVGAERQACAERVNNFRDELGLKYGIDFTVNIIRSEDGVVIPRAR